MKRRQSIKVIQKAGDGLLSLVSLLLTKMMIDGAQTCFHPGYQTIGKCFVAVFEKWKVIFTRLAATHKLVLANHLALPESLAGLDARHSVGLGHLLTLLDAPDGHEDGLAGVLGEDPDCVGDTTVVEESQHRVESGSDAF